MKHEDTTHSPEQKIYKIKKLLQYIVSLKRSTSKEENESLGVMAKEAMRCLPSTAGKKRLPISVIAAVDANLGIAKNNRIPWPFIPEDMKNFVKVTNNTVCIMGRHTYEELLDVILSKNNGKLPTNHLLSNRMSIVLSRNDSFRPTGAIKLSSLDEAIKSANVQFPEMDGITIIGGVSLFREGIQIADTLHISNIPGNYDCDSFFPNDHTLKQDSSFMLNSYLTYSNFTVGVYKRIT